MWDRSKRVAKTWWSLVVTLVTYSVSLKLDQYNLHQKLNLVWCKKFQRAVNPSRKETSPTAGEAFWNAAQSCTQRAGDACWLKLLWNDSEVGSAKLRNLQSLRITSEMLLFLDVNQTHETCCKCKISAVSPFSVSFHALCSQETRATYSRSLIELDQWYGQNIEFSGIVHSIYIRSRTRIFQPGF